MAQNSTPVAKQIRELLAVDGRLYYLFLVLLFLVIRYLTDILVLESIPDSDRLTSQGDLTFFFLFNALNYLWTPFALLWKFTVTAFLFWSIGLMIGFKAPFKELWKFALISETVFILPELLRLLIFMNSAQDFTYLEVRNFEPLSLLSLLGPENLDSKFHYPLSVLNIFEILYGFIWVYGFHTISRRNFSESTTVVLIAYYLPLLIWLGFYIGAYR